MRSLHGIVVLALLGTALVWGRAEAAWQFEATIDGSHETPPNNSPAQGLGSFTLDDTQTIFSYYIYFWNWSGTEIAAHIHNGPPGVEGPIVLHLPLGELISDDWAIPPALVPELFGGNLYVNIHNLNSDLDIRGPILAVAVPTEGATWGGVKALYK